jgi:hypothetical protein
LLPRVVVALRADLSRTLLLIRRLLALLRCKERREREQKAEKTTKQSNFDFSRSHCPGQLNILGLNKYSRNAR